MCQAIQEIREEGRKEGRLEGEIMGAIRSNKRWGIPQEDIRQHIMEEYQKSEEEANRLIKIYWK